MKKSISLCHRHAKAYEMGMLSSMLRRHMDHYQRHPRDLRAVDRLMSALAALSWASGFSPSKLAVCHTPLRFGQRQIIPNAIKSLHANPAWEHEHLRHIHVSALRYWASQLGGDR